MALNKLTADALVDGTLDADAIGPASITTAKLHSNIISGQTAIGTVDASNDLLLIYDNNTTSLKKVPVSSVGATNTDSITEGSSNLYYTNARADARAQLKIDALVDSAPGTLDTLNELAAALGDDANFSTTVTNSIATKLPLAGGTLTGNIAHASDFTIDVGGDITLDADGGDIILKDGGTEYGKLSQVLGGLTIKSGPSSTPAIVMDGSGNVIGGGNYTTSGVGSFSKVVATTGSIGSQFYAGEFSRSSSSITTPDIWGTNGTLVFGSDASTEAIGISGANSYFHGNVGIGTDNPGARKLKIYGSSSAYPLALDSTDTDYALEFQRNGTSEWWFKASASNFKLHENGVGDHFTVAAGGNVGIGTGTPGQELDIASANPAVRLTDTTTSGLYHDLVSYGNDLRFSADGGNVQASTVIEFYIDNAEKMNLTGDNGLRVTSDTGNSSTQDNISIVYNGTAGGHTSGLLFRDKRDAVNAAVKNDLQDDSAANYAAHMRFQTAHGGSLTTKMTIDRYGRVMMPLQPSFRAWPSTDFTSNGVLEAAQWTEQHDTNNDFSNGRFTCPVDGVYLFTVMWDSLSSTAGLNLLVNTNSYYVKWEPTGVSNASWESRAYSTTVKLSSGDYVRLEGTHASGSNPFHMGAGYWGHFAGHLLG